jgi:hypothetical protein
MMAMPALAAQPAEKATLQKLRVEPVFARRYSRVTATLDA